jgi:uncharacterized sporulation protein YeaH/YhbH (DUF444 family)
MNATPRDDLSSFHQFVGELVSSNSAPRSPEDALQEWRALHPDAEAAAVECAAIQEAIDDLEAGDEGIPFEEFDQAFRERHRLPPPS